MSASAPVATSSNGAEFTVRGRVQGVGYRAFVRTHALALGLQGTAVNLDNGDVRVVAFGSAIALDRLHGELLRGPLLAHVEHVIRRELSARPALYQSTVFSIG